MTVSPFLDSNSVLLPQELEQAPGPHHILALRA